MKLCVKIIAALCFALVLLQPAVPAENGAKYSLLMHGEYGSFNKVYRSKEYVGNDKTFFPVNMRNAGAELHYRAADGSTFGGGIVYAEISGGRKYNVDSYVVVPETEISVPYFFIGNDFGFMALEFGMSYYLTLREEQSRCYYKPDGSIEKEESGFDYFSRPDSYVLVNFMLRLLPEKSLHFKIRFGRERFNIIDSLFNAAIVYPWKNHSAEIYVSSPTNFSAYLPTSNLRTGICYSYKINFAEIGAHAGYLTSNPRGGGDGNMPIFDPDNFNYGIFVRVLN